MIISCNSARQINSSVASYSIFVANGFVATNVQEAPLAHVAKGANHAVIQANLEGPKEKRPAQALGKAAGWHLRQIRCGRLSDETHGLALKNSFITSCTINGDQPMRRT